MADVKLKPCPFCGGECHLVGFSSAARDITEKAQCTECAMSTFWHYEIGGAAKQWNHRPIEDANAALLREAAGNFKRIKPMLVEAVGTWISEEDHTVEVNRLSVLIQRLEEAGKESK